MSDSIPDFLKNILNGKAPVDGTAFTPDETPDIDAFDEAFEECRKIFVERRGKYGSHFDKVAQYLADGLRLKMTLALFDIDRRNKIDRDTLVDLTDYALMLLSLRYK